MPFTLFSMASIVLFLHYERSGKKISFFGSLLLATIAFYTRTIGIALFLSFLLWFLYQRRLKASFWALAFMLCATVPWFCWGYENSASTSSLPTFYGSYSSWFFSSRSSSSYIPNFLILFKLPALLYIKIKLASISLSIILTFMFVAFFWLFFLKGILYQLRKSPSIDTFYLLVTIFIVALWPPGFSTRLLVPLLPIILFHLMEGVKAARKDMITFFPAWRGVARPLWGLGVAMLLVGIFVVGNPLTTNRLIRERFNNSEALFLKMENACDWIKDNTDRGDVISSNFDPLVFLLSERRSINVGFESPYTLIVKPENTCYEDDISEALHKYGVTYLLITYFEPDGSAKLLNESLSEIIKKYPDAFHKCYEKKRAVAIYRVKRQYLVDEGNSSISAKLFLPRRD